LHVRLVMLSHLYHLLLYCALYHRDLHYFTTRRSSDLDMEIGKLHWDGKNNYEKDQMEANNSIAIETQGLARDLFVLHLDVVGEQIKEVEAADPEEGKNLGEMSGEEVI